MTITRIKAVAVCVGAAVALVAAGCAKKETPTTQVPEVQYPTKTVHLMAPAAAGGGWDSTARSLQKALKDANLTTQAVEVANVPGAGGTIGLAQFVTQNQKDAHQLMVMGMVMIGAQTTNKSAVKVTQTTPIATLTAEAELIVVKSDSKYTTLKQLVDDLKANPTSVKVGGGSAGGTDQILVGMLAKAAGLDVAATKSGYVAYAGGGELKTALLAGDVVVGVSSTSEFADLVTAGTLRPLAVSAAQPVTIGSTTVPTIKESGYDVELMNWRGIVAAPGITDGERAAVIKLIDNLHASSQWKAVLAERKWEDFYKSGDDAKAFFESETTRITGVLTDLGLA